VLALAHHYDEPVARAGITYRARVYTEVQTDGMWTAWIVFFPAGGGRVISTDRETTQSNLNAVRYWASGLTHTYLHGALDRALSLQPELRLARELDRLERLEESAELHAETHEAAAAEVRMESGVVADVRERAEERLLSTTARTAKADARAHETAAAAAREMAKAADGALRSRKRPAAKNPKKK
jgi:hypothetical protein